MNITNESVGIKNETITTQQQQQQSSKIKQKSKDELINNDDQQLQQIKNEQQADVKMELDNQQLNNISNNQANETKHQRIVLNLDQINELTKDDLIQKWRQQNDYIDSLEEKLKLELLNKDVYQDNEDKIKQQLFDLTRKENLLLMKLTTKEHEIQDYIKQIQELKLSQIASNDRLQSTFIDPAVNMIFEEMKKEVEKNKLKVEEMQSELSAWKFTPDSNTGKRLMAKCRLLYQENEELGKVISSGRIAKLEGELALQKSFSEEMKKGQQELEEFLNELDEDVEGLQSTIYCLQQKLKDTNDQLQKYKLKEENQLKENSINNSEQQSIDKVNESTADLNDNDDELDTNSKQTTENENKSTESDCRVITNDDKIIDGLSIEQQNKVDNDDDINLVNSVQKNGDNVDKSENELNQTTTTTTAITTNEMKTTIIERKRSLDEALEEVNSSAGLMSDCGIGNIIKKHRKIEQEKSDKEQLNHHLN